MHVGWVVLWGIASSSPSLWAGNLTHSSVSLRFFGGAHNIAIRTAPECPSANSFFAIEGEASGGFVLNGSWVPFASSLTRWLLRLWGLPPLCPLLISGDVTGRIRTLSFPDDETQATVLAFGSCDRFDMFGKNMVVYQEIARLQPNLLVHMGDLHYRDIQDDDPAVFVQAFEEVLGLPQRQSMLQTVPMAYVWNDHDYGTNDANAANIVKNSAREAYENMVPHYLLQNSTGPIYQAFTVHRVRVLMLDVNFDWTPNVRLISDQQLQWAMAEIRNASNWRLLILVSGVPFGGASTGQWGSPGSQRDLILEAAKGQTNVIVVSGDAHVLAYDDGTHHANIPQLAAGPLANLGSQKGARFSGAGGDSPNCLAYKGTPNQQFGTIEVRTINNLTSVFIRGYRIDPDDSLRTVFDVARTLPFAPALSASQFNLWEGSSGECQIALMPAVDSASWIMCSLCVWLVLLVGTHVLRDGRFVLRNVVSPKKIRCKALVFWFVIQLTLCIVGTLLIGLGITQYIDPSINSFSTRSGLGYSLLFTTLFLTCMIGAMLLCARSGVKCSSAFLYFVESQPSPRTDSKDSDEVELDS